MKETGGGQMNNIYMNGFQLRIEDDNLITLLFFGSRCLLQTSIINPSLDVSFSSLCIGLTFLPELLTCLTKDGCWEEVLRSYMDLSFLCKSRTSVGAKYTL